MISRRSFIASVSCAVASAAIYCRMQFTEAETIETLEPPHPKETVIEESQWSSSSFEQFALRMAGIYGSDPVEVCNEHLDDLPDDEPTLGSRFWY